MVAGASATGQPRARPKNTSWIGFLGGLALVLIQQISLCNKNLGQEDRRVTHLSPLEFEDDASAKAKTGFPRTVEAVWNVIDLHEPDRQIVAPVAVYATTATKR